VTLWSTTCRERVGPATPKQVDLFELKGIAMRQSVAVLTILLTTSSAGVALSQEIDETQASRELRASRMSLMRSRVAALTATGRDGNLLAFGEEAAMRYNDTPRGVVDASVWILGAGGRPPAVLVLEFYDNNTVMFELTANDVPPQSVEGAGWKWTPEDAEFEWVKVPLDVAPGGTARLRKSQLKILVQDFAASEEFNGQTHQLRVLPRPIYEYEESDRGVLTGAVFVIANGTNAEILMLVEAREKSGTTPAHWVAGFSRLATASLEVTYAKQDFWSSPQESEYNPNRLPRNAAAYFSQGDLLDEDEREAFRKR
jgi:hypothetical protein